MLGWQMRRAVQARRAAAVWICGIAAVTGVARAQSPVAAYSSSAGAETPERSRSVVVSPPQQQQVDLYADPVRPFSRFGVAAEAGTLGLGVELATPLSRTLQIRGGADFLNFGYGLTVDAAQYEGEAHLRGGHINADWYPFGGSFRISPGVLVFASGFGASVSVAGGKTFELGDSTYTSSASDPVHGSAAISMERKMMPALTIGWGNLLGEGRQHWNIPFEIGAAYTGQYSVKLNLAGTACTEYACMSTATPQVQQSVSQEEGQLNETMKHYQVYPIIGTGFSFRF